MSRQQQTYGFDGLPLEPVEPGTNLLVTGPVLGGMRSLVLTLLCRQRPREGVLFITVDDDGVTTLADYERVGGDLDVARVGAVDCTGEGTADPERNIAAVGSPSDLTGIGIEFSGLYEQLHGNGAESVRTGLYTLSPLLMYANDIRSVYRFLHTLTGRIRTADGLGVCALDDDAVDDQTFSSIAQAFDGEVRLREDDSGLSIRVRGLQDQPDGWLPVAFD